MTAPVFQNAGTGASDIAGAWTYTCQASQAVGRVFIVEIVQDGTATGQITVTGATNIENLAGTDNAWTAIAVDQPIGSPTAGLHHLYIGRALGTAAPTISGGNAFGDDIFIRSYQYSDVNLGTTLASVIENSSAGSIINGVGTGTTVLDTGVTTLGPDRLICNFVGINDDVAIDAFVGMTGGVWREAIAEYADSAGTDAALQLQIDDDVVFPAFGGVLASSLVQGSGGTNEQQAASFSVAGTEAVRYIVALLSKVGSPVDNVFFELQADSAGSPSGTALATSSTIAGGSLFTGGGSWISLDLSYSLSGGTTYWLVAKRSGARDTVNYFNWASAGTITGVGHKKLDSGVWSADIGGQDPLFSVNDNGAARTVDGGSDAIVTAGWGVIGFALIGTTVVVPTISGFTPSSGIAGTSVVITGTNFTGATAVKFGGIDAQSFTVDSSTQITATAPIGGTGTIAVTTPGGTGTSGGSFTATLPGTSSAYAVAVLADSPVAYYRMQEPSGLIEDSSGNNRHATVKAGSPVYSQVSPITIDSSDLAINFASAWFSTPDHAVLDVGDVFSVEAWVRRNNLTDTGTPQTILARGDQSFQVYLVPGTGKIALSKYNITGVGESTAGITETTTWHHVVVTKNGSTVKWYLDTVDVTPGSYSNQTMINNTEALEIGSAFASPFGDYIADFKMDEVALYATALSPTRISAHYAARSPSPGPPGRVQKASALALAKRRM